MTDNADLAFGTGDHTVELWVYPNTLVSNDCLYDGRQSTGGATTGFSIVVNSSGQVQTYTAGGYRCSSTAQLKVGKWSHIAVVRSSGTDTLFMDGIAQADTDTTNGNYTDQKCRIGSDVNGDESWGGHISDFRLYKGVAKYTSNFIPASTNPDILPDTPSGVSGSSKLAKITDGAVSFDGSGDSLSIADNADFDFGTGDFTVELFTYNDLAQASNPVLIGATGGWYVQFKTGGTIVEFYTGSTSIQATGLGLEGGWHHIAVTKASNVVKIFIDGILKSTTSNSDTTNLASTLYIGNLNGASLHYLGFISNVRILKGTALYTSNFTPPSAPLTNVTNTKLLCCQSNTLAGTAAVVPGASGINAGTPWSEFVTIPEGVTGTNYNDDASNWFDGDTSTSASLFSGNMVAPYSPTTVVFTPPSPITVSTGVRVYMAVDRGQTILINGTQTNASVSAGWNDTGFTGTLTSLTLGPSNAGSSSNPSALEIDGVILKNLVLPKGNAAATNFNPFTTDINAVRGQETGYTTWNPLDIQGLDVGDLKDGNLSITHSAGDWLAVRANKFVSSGKWYYEVKVGNNQYTSFGVGSVDYKINPTANDWCNVANVYGFYPYNGKVYDAATGRSYATADTSAAGNVYGIAIDMDNRSLRFYENGRDLGVAFDSTTSTNFVNKESVAPMAWLYNQSGTDDYNFGQKPFKFPPPDGFQPLNAANVRPVKVFARPDQYVGVTTYTGNGGTQSINVGLKPDLVWFKNRDQSYSHMLMDSVRGDGNTKWICSDLSREQGVSSGNGDAVFTSDGFQLRVPSSTNTINGSGDDCVSWAWKAGGNKNTFNVDDVGYASAAAAGLDGGTLTVTGSSVGTKQGFSIITYNGAGNNTNAATSPANSISHGLSQSPNFVITKKTNNTGDWVIRHPGVSTNYLIEFTTGAQQGPNYVYNATLPDENFVYFGNNGQTNNSGDSYVSYIWHDVPGLQKFGIYEGNADADGTFVELGFRPILLWRKGIDNNSRGWYITDAIRDASNPVNTFLDASDADADGSGTAVDFLSNGFKLRNADAGTNYSETYIYCAWAEAPTFNLYGAQSNAR